jgi:hypothetical protein
MAFVVMFKCKHKYALDVETVNQMVVVELYAMIVVEMFAAIAVAQQHVLLVPEQVIVVHHQHVNHLKMVTSVFKVERDLK